MIALRALLAGLALSSAVVGAWAALAPRSFHADFPGGGRHWVDRLGGYSEHLVTDVGGFYLAFTLLFAWAAVRPARALVLPLASAWALFSTIHLAWHSSHLGAFATGDAIAQTASLAITLAAALAVIALARRAGTRA